MSNFMDDPTSKSRQQLQDKIGSLKTAIQRIRDTMPSRQNRTKVSPEGKLSKQKRIHTLQEQVLQLRERKLRLRKEED